MVQWIRSQIDFTHFPFFVDKECGSVGVWVSCVSVSPEIVSKCNSYGFGFGNYFANHSFGLIDDVPQCSAADCNAMWNLIRARNDFGSRSESHKSLRSRRYQMAKASGNTNATRHDERAQTSLDLLWSSENSVVVVESDSRRRFCGNSCVRFCSRRACLLVSV